MCAIVNRGSLCLIINYRPHCRRGPGLTAGLGLCGCASPMSSGVVGILSGISYISGIDYYKGINDKVTQLVPKKHLMPPNPLMVLVSVDCDEYARRLVAKDWEGVSKYLASSVERLVAAGADFLVIASNTGHICCPTLARLYPSLPVLHIADCTARAIKAQGFSTVGLLGTEPTMRESYLKDRLAAHGLAVLVPERDEDLKQIFQHIVHELGFNVFKDETRAFFAAQVRALAARGAQGVILGCTEIELLIQQEHVSEVPLYQSAALHIEAVAQVLAGQAGPRDFAPAAEPPAGKKVFRPQRKLLAKQDHGCPFGRDDISSTARPDEVTTSGGGIARTEGRSITSSSFIFG